MKTNNVLLIIDVQSPFVLNFDKYRRLIWACQREIRRSMRKNEEIIFVEYAGYNPTHKVLTDLVASYDNAHYIIKFNDGGADEIDSHIYLSGLKVPTFRYCGVNASACVRSTIKGLKQKRSYWGSKFIAIADAIDDVYSGITAQKLLTKIQEEVCPDRVLYKDNVARYPWSYLSKQKGEL